MKNNNDILKDEVRKLKSNGKLGAIGSTAIAKANRSQLIEWLEACGIDAAQVIADYRKSEGAPAAAPAAARSTDSNAPKKIGASPSADKVAKDLASLLASAGGKDEELRNDVEELKAKVESLSNDQVRTLTIQIGDAPNKVNAGKVHKSFEDLMLVAQCRQHAFLTGPAGSFKTSSAEKVADVLGLECSAVSVCLQTTASTLLGYMNATGSYVSTEFRKRYENGGVFILDEIDNGNANVLAVLNSALANGSCAFPDGMVKRHKDFVLVATANTFGTGATAKYVGRNKLDAATLDRFATIEWSYDEDLEFSICPTDWCKRVQSIRKAVDELGIDAVVSPRATFKGRELLEAGMDQDKVEKLLIFKGMKQSQVDKVLAKVK